MPLYVSPSLLCRGYEKIQRGYDWGFHTMALPYPDIPEVTEEQWRELGDTDPLESPPDEWTVLFGCRECGHVDTYAADDVALAPLERQQSARFHNETNCFSVELRCARIDCKAPAKLHVTLFAGESEKDLIRLLRSSHFDGLLPCGHQVLPIPELFYRDAHRVMSRLW